MFQWSSSMENMLEKSWVVGSKMLWVTGLWQSSGQKITETPVLWSERQNTVMVESWGEEEKQRISLISSGVERDQNQVLDVQIK